MAAEVDTSLLNVPPQIRSTQLGGDVGNLPTFIAHGMIIQSLPQELGPMPPTIDVTGVCPAVFPLRANARDLLLPNNTNLNNQHLKNKLIYFKETLQQKKITK